MIEHKTIVCFASGYDAPPTSKHHVMHLLAERNTVLWINYHGSRTPSASGSDLLYMARKLAEVAGGIQKKRENLYTLTPLVLPLPGSKAARRVNRSIVVHQVKRALSQLQNGPVQVWSFTPDVGYVLDHLDPERVIYYCVDDHAQFTGYNREQVLADEESLARRSDLVITTSTVLQESKAPWNSNTVLIPHGVDYEHFSRAMHNSLPCPDDLAAIPRPRLGFFGLIRDWVDLDMLAEIARRRPEWHFVLLGDSTIDLGPFRAIGNMHFLGHRPYECLPAYCRHFDVGLIPFRVNELTRAVNPIKLREYLAAGLPVVSTPMPEVKLYDHLIHIADGSTAFESALSRALQTTDPSSRQTRSQAMERESWLAKVEEIATLVEAHSDLPQPVG